MTGGAKILLSEAEERLMRDADVILTKLAVVAKIEALFGRLADTYREIAAPLEVLLPTAMVWQPKISRGEKYEQLPWLMLDYPRHFGKTNGQLAVRSFFWWGHYFSLQLQASGVYLAPLQQALLTAQDDLVRAGWQTALVTEAWDYTLPLHGRKLEYAAQSGELLKLVNCFPLQQLNCVEEHFTSSFKIVVELIERAFRPLNGETSLLPDNSTGRFDL